MPTDNTEQYLAHYGVLGMKWGVRHNPQKAYEKSKKKIDKINKKISKYDARSKKHFTKGVNRSGGIFASEKGANRSFNRASRNTRKALRLTQKGNKWISRMEKEFAKQSIVELDPAISAQGASYANRLTQAADTMYMNSLRR